MVLIFEDSNNREDLLHHINHMIRQKVINEEQGKELLKEEELDLDKFINQLKQVKVGRGLKFLPRLTNGLLDKRKEWLVSLKKEKNSKQLKCNLMAVLDELLQRRAISKKKNIKTLSNNMSLINSCVYNNKKTILSDIDT